MAVVCLFTTALHTGALGALLTFSRIVWYPVYRDTTIAWGLTPLEDQQLGGLILWVPASLVFVGVGLALFAKWIGAPEKRSAAVLPVLLVLIMSTSCGVGIDRPKQAQAALLETGGDPARGKAAIGRYGCGSCHTIPNIEGAKANVGPPLTRIATRTYLAGVLTNTPDNMRRWLQNPPAIDEKTAMPNMGVSDQDAIDIVAFLYTLP